jgi:hypothetical protein
MTPLKEIRTIHACPVVGEKGTRTVTSTFEAGKDGVVSIGKDGPDVVVRGQNRTLLIPFAACCWCEPVTHPLDGISPPAIDAEKARQILAMERGLQGNARKDGAHNPAVAEYPPGTPEPSPKERDKAAHGSGASPAGAPKPGVVKGKK